LAQSISRARVSKIDLAAVVAVDGGLVAGFELLEAEDEGDFFGEKFLEDIELHGVMAVDGVGLADEDDPGGGEIVEDLERRSLRRPARDRARARQGGAELITSGGGTVVQAERRARAPEANRGVGDS